MPGRRLATITLLAAGAGLLASLPLWMPTTTEQSQGTVGDSRVIELIREGRKEDLGDSERRELLERLLTSGRQWDAQRFLEASAEAPWSCQQRLLLIDLQRRNGDLKAASEGMERLQRLHPSHPDVLSQQGLLTLKTASPEAALNVMEQRLKAASADQRINLGLLLADAQLRSGKKAAAVATYQDLAKTNQQDTRSLIAHALLAQEMGDHKTLMGLLNEARRREEVAGRPTDRIEELAASWGVSAARLRVLEPKQGTSQTP